MSDPWRTWMPLDIGRYLKDTGRLSTLEHGAYLLLIMDYWNAGSLPQDDASLCSIARLQPKQWQAMKPKIAAFFRPDWTHKKVEKELAEAEAKYRRRAKAGRTGGIAKAENQREASIEGGNKDSNATVNASSIDPPAAIHNTQRTVSDETVWVGVRERVTRAFAKAGSPNSPDTSHVEIWRSRSYDPTICLAVIGEILSRKPSISRLTYFDQPIADAHIIPQGQARAGPCRAAGGDERHDFIEKLRAARDGNADHHEGDDAEDANVDPGAHLARLPQPH